MMTRVFDISTMNVGLRAAGLIFRFTLTVFIAKYLDLESLGIASFLFAAIAITYPLLSFGLHYRLNREMVGRPILEAGRHLRDRLVLHCALVLALALAAGLLLAEGAMQAIAPGVAAWIVVAAFLLASLELISSELHHGLISLDKSVLANAFLFFRSSSWAPLFVAAAFMFEDLRTIPALLAFWMCGSGLAYVFLFRALRQWPWAAIIRLPTDFRWLFVNLRQSVVVYCTDISIAVAQYADRVIIAGLLGIREAGIYFFYWSFAAGINQLINSGVIQVSMPLLVQSGRDGGGALLAAMLRNLRVALMWSAALGAACLAFVTMLVNHLGQPQIAEHLHFMPIMLVGTVFSVCADVMSTVLYAKKLDSAWALAKFAAVGGALLFTTGGILAFGFVGAPLGAAASALGTLMLRAWLVRKALGRDASSVADAQRAPAMKQFVARLGSRLRRSAARLVVRQVRAGPEVFEVAQSLGASVLSVDLFDTLVYRRCGSPQDVFVLLHRRCPALARRIDAQEWVRLRAGVEHELSEEAHPAEVSLARIYDGIARRLELTRAEANAILTAELAAEADLIAPVQCVVAALRRCRDAGMRIVVNTDTYLPEDFVARLLSDMLPFDFDLLCSSATSATKRSGQAFGVLERQYPGSVIVHFGDNLHADVLMASHSRVQAVRLVNPRADFLARNEAFVTHLRALGIHCMATPCDQAGAGPLELARQELAWRWAVLLADLIPEIAAYAREIEADEIWFLSRDGESVFAAVQAAGFGFGRAQIKYVHSSRAASYPIAAEADPQAFEDWTGRCATPADRAQGGQLALAYRSQLSPGSRRILTVDTGWRGRVQHCLQLALKPCEVFGYYLSLRPGAEPAIAGRVRTFVDWDRSILNQAGAEVLAGFGEPSCEGYGRAADGAWVPRFRPAVGDTAPEAYRLALRRYLCALLAETSAAAPASPALLRRATLRRLFAFPDTVAALAFDQWGMGAGMDGASGVGPLLQGGRAGVLARLLGREVADNLWPELAMWGLTRSPSAVTLLQSVMNLRMRLQHRLAAQGRRSAMVS